jgi:hypothetical protein
MFAAIKSIRTKCEYYTDFCLIMSLIWTVFRKTSSGGAQKTPLKIHYHTVIIVFVYFKRHLCNMCNISEIRTVFDFFMKIRVVCVIFMYTNNFVANWKYVCKSVTYRISLESCKLMRWDEHSRC